LDSNTNLPKYCTIREKMHKRKFATAQSVKVLINSGRRPQVSTNLRAGNERIILKMEPKKGNRSDRLFTAEIESNIELE
jgi:hypothetical protein